MGSGALRVVHTFFREAIYISKAKYLFQFIVRRNGRELVAATVITLLTLLAGSSVPAAAESTPTIVVEWNKAALQGVRDSKIGPPMVARALFIVHNCVYDAWAAYDYRAVGTVFGTSLRRPKSERTLANKNQAISFAAYRAAVDLFPGDKVTVFDPLMAKLGYDINDNSTGTATPTGIGNAACQAILAIRHNDGSNQLGNLTAAFLTPITLATPLQILQRQFRSGPLTTTPALTRVIGSH